MPRYPRIRKSKFTAIAWGVAALSIAGNVIYAIHAGATGNAAPSIGAHATSTAGGATASTGAHPRTTTAAAAGTAAPASTTGGDAAGAASSGAVTRVPSDALAYVYAPTGRYTYLSGTAIVLTSTGKVLTNDHLIASARFIQVTDVANRTRYSATVICENAAADVAELQLKDASGLVTASIATSAPFRGEAVTAAGNAESRFQFPVPQATGEITETGATKRINFPARQATLTGLILSDARTVPGDSGGALFNEQGQVIGMNTAAAAPNAKHSGYVTMSLPIQTALAEAAE